MKILSEEKIKWLAERNGWSPLYAQGYVDGESYRRRGTTPSTYAQIGIDEYCLGFRAGYYERSGPGPARSSSSQSSFRMRKNAGRP